jgi:hypothetical protein
VLVIDNYSHIVAVVKIILKIKIFRKNNMAYSSKIIDRQNYKTFVIVNKEVLFNKDV